MKSIEIYKCKLVKDRCIDYFGIANSPDAIIQLAKKLGYHEFCEEHMGIFCMNSGGEVASYHEVSHGDITSSVANPGEIFKRAMLSNASYIIVVHNHPSGNPHPSDEDIATTKRLFECGKLLNIPVVDHIIIAFGGESHSLAYVRE